MGKAIPKLNPRYVADEKGKYSAVLIDLRDYKKLIGFLEDIEDVLDYLKRQKEPLLDFDKEMAKLKKAGRL